MARREDPMSSLMSNVGGIDASLFQRPQAMKDSRAQQGPQPERPGASDLKVQARQSNQVQQQQPTQTFPNFAGPKTAAKPSSGSAYGQSSRSPLDADKKLSEMLSGSLNLKTQRPMRTPESKPQRSNVAVSVQAPSQTQSQGMGTRKPSQYSDDLDNIFGPAGGFTGVAPVPSAQPSHDPFDLFGGLGTTQTARQSPPSTQTADDDLLAGFREPSSGVLSPPSIRSRSQIASPLSARHSQNSLGGSDDWGGMLDAGGLVSPTSSVTSQQAVARQISARSLKSPGGHNKSSGSLVDMPPPSYESVMQQSEPRQRVGSPRSDKVASPRSHLRKSSSGSYQHFRDDDLDRLGSDAAQQRIPAHIREHRQQQANRDGDMKEQAKQWLSAGKGWLSGASKKVAQAVKETKAHIDSKLDELEGRQGTGQGAQREKQPSRRQEKTQTEDEIPKYYYEWAETIAALPGPEQVNTLAAMPEDDARMINKILKQRGRRPSVDLSEESMLEEAKRRSLSSTYQGGAEQHSRTNSGLLSATSPSTNPPTRGARPRSATASTSGPAPLPSSRSQPAAEADLLSNQSSQRSPAPQASSSSFINGTKPASVSQKQSPAQTSVETHDLMGFGGESSGQERAPERTDKNAEVAPSADLMGLGDPIHGEGQAQQSGTAPAQDQTTADLMGFDSSIPENQVTADLLGSDELDGFATNTVPGAQEAPARQSASSVSRQRPQPQPQSQPETAIDPDLAELMGHSRPSAGPSMRGPIGDSMIDFGDEAVPVDSRHQDLYQGSAMDEEQEGEPEARKIARRKRLADKHARMQKQLAEKHARDKADEEKQEAQHDLRLVHRERVEAWKSGKKDNIRALLSTLHTILWEGSGWTAPGMTDLVEVSKVKRCYMKANLVVHPDKVKQKGGSVEQIVIADMAFDTLKAAWNKFETTELKR